MHPSATQNQPKFLAPKFLASVTSAAEADAALNGGADIIDAKDPLSGALGALPHDVVRAIVSRVGGHVPVSATVGDLPAEPRVLVEAAAAMALNGVAIIKIGFFGNADARPAIDALGRAPLEGAQRVAVLMADRDPDFSLIPVLALNGFSGVMLDTASKPAGSLIDALSSNRLAAFVHAVRTAHMLAGLAGSLSIGHIAALASLKPDILGFRGALCDHGRTSALDPAKVRAVRLALDQTHISERPAA